MCVVAAMDGCDPLKGNAPAPPKHPGQLGGEAMDQNERGIIDGLFERLRKAEDQAGPRDPDAEALIRRHTAAQPAAPYYMAQAIVVQQEALARAQARIQELARASAPPAGFSRGCSAAKRPRRPRRYAVLEAGPALAATRRAPAAASSPVRCRRRLASPAAS